MKKVLILILILVSTTTMQSHAQQTITLKEGDTLVFRDGKSSIYPKKVVNTISKQQQLMRTVQYPSQTIIVQQPVSESVTPVINEYYTYAPPEIQLSHLMLVALLIITSIIIAVIMIVNWPKGYICNEHCLPGQPVHFNISGGAGGSAVINKSDDVIINHNKWRTDNYHLFDNEDDKEPKPEPDKTVKNSL